MFCPSMNCEYTKMSILTAVSMEMKMSEVNLEGKLFALKEKLGLLNWEETWSAGTYILPVIPLSLPWQRKNANKWLTNVSPA